jgi:hypothetical protein
MLPREEKFVSIIWEKWFQMKKLKYKVVDFDKSYSFI